jgi:hypothetical protein
MATPLGLRQVKVFNVVADEEIVIDNYRGAFLYHEVTNDTASDVEFEVNANREGGHPGAKIPIKAGTTRALPLALYKFKASGALTVVSYGM